MSKRFPDIKSVTDLRNWLRDTHPKLDDCVEDKQSALRIAEVCAMELANLERERDALHETVKSLSNKLGELSIAGVEVKYRAVGQAQSKSAGCSYTFGVLDDAPNLPCVVNSRGRVWAVAWAKLVERAIADGIDSDANNLVRVDFKANGAKK